MEIDYEDPGLLIKSVLTLFTKYRVPINREHNLVSLVIDRRSFTQKSSTTQYGLGKVKLMHECFLKHSRMGTARMK